MTRSRAGFVIAAIAWATAFSGAASGASQAGEWTQDPPAVRAATELPLRDVSRGPVSDALDTVAREEGEGRVGARREVFEVPAAGRGVRLSSLIVVKRTEELDGDRDPEDPLQFWNVKIVPGLGEPVVKTGDSRLVLFSIIYPDRRLPYNPGLGIEFSRGGQVVGATQPQLPPDRNEDGDIPFVITFPLDHFDPGEYRVRLVAQQGNTYAESRTEFRVVAP